MNCRDREGTEFAHKTIVCADGEIRMVCNNGEWLDADGACTGTEPAAVIKKPAKPAADAAPESE